MSIDFRAYPVLYVDDEAPNLVTMQYVLDEHFTVLATTSAKDALATLQEREDVAILIADQRMPEMSGADLCAKAREVRPDVARMIVTAYADLHMAMDAINRGQVSRYITKPWRGSELIDLLKTSIELVAMQRTITALEMRLVRAAPQTAIGTLRAELAHELSSPLHALSMTQDHVRDLLEAALRTPDAGRVREMLESARESHADSVAAVEQLTGLVRRLRQAAPSKPPPSDTDVARVVESTVRILRSEVQRVAKLGIIVDDSPQAPIDPTSLGQVVMNLLLNAAQAVEQEERPEHRITVRVASDGPDALLQVSDTGPGIPPESMERIFDPFYTTKSGGSGLGLAIVRDLLSRVGGRIDASNADGGGATFSVRIPRV